jgi:expansin
MPRVPHRPVHGNWIWLVTGVLSATLLTGAALHYQAIACPAGPATQAGAAGPAAATQTVTASASPQPAATPSQPPAASGQAVFYDPGSAVGSCSLGPVPADGLYVSLPPQQYAAGAACGTYLDVQGPAGQARVEVVDLCPTCAATSINLDRAAYERVVGAGPAQVTYRQVLDPPLPGPIVLHVAATASGLPTVQVVNNGNRLTSVAVAPSASAAARWQQFTLGPNDFWVAPTSPGAGPVAVRITDSLGHQVVVSRVTLAPGSTIRSRVWMYRAISGATANTTAGTATSLSPPASRPTHSVPGSPTSVPC